MSAFKAGMIILILVVSKNKKEFLMGIILLYLLFIGFISFSAIIFVRKKSGNNGNSIDLVNKRDSFLFLFPSILLLVIIFGYPFVNSFIMAFQSYKLTALNKVSFNGLDNFRKLVGDGDFGLIVKNSFVYVILAVMGQFLLGMGLAFALKKDFFLRGLYQAVIFLPWAFSAFVIGLMHRWSFNGE
jgi:multiple sugar transport system permease protein